MAKTNAIIDELSEKLEVSRKKKDDDQSFWARLVTTASDLDDKAYNKLKISKTAQKWLDKATQAVENEDEIKAPKSASSDEDETPAKGKKANGKANGKSDGKKAKGNGGGRREAAFSRDQTIKVLVSENPKREGTAAYDRFKLYFKKSVKTVGDALDAGLKSGDLNWDVKHEHISIK